MTNCITGTCGGTWRLYGGFLSSPSYPDPVNKPMNCSWRVIGLLYHSLNIKINEASLYNTNQSPNQNCSAVDSSTHPSLLTFKDDLDSM